MNKFLTIFAFFIVALSQAQQLNCIVNVNTQKITNTNQQIFKTLEQSVTEFVNKTDWTGKVYSQNEKINCSFYITIVSYSSDQFSASIQVQSTRPIYNSTYSSPVINFNDKDFNFKYTEFENLQYNENSFESNLVSVLAYYSYLIIGMDQDSFALESGTTNFEKAQNITNLAQQSGFKGWSQLDGNQNRYFYINDLLSPTYAAIRKTNLEYHTGLDLMTKDLKTSKEAVKAAILNLSKLHLSKPNAFLTRTFFDAKSDEIVSIFTGGPSVTISDLVEALNKISPLNSSKWITLKY
jgi:hypothetical protein